MYKASYYNHYVQIDESKYLLYNAMKCSFTVINKKIYSLFKLESDFDKHWNCGYVSEDIKKRLLDVGAVVDYNLSEIELVKQARLRRRFSTLKYDLTINLSMNCNLSCWYCYENHIPGSSMTMETANKVYKHIKQHHSQTRYKSLAIKFFGGEPLLNPNVCIYLLEKCSDYCVTNNISFSVLFTTNGTCITEFLLSKLKNFNTIFQITLDGGQERHDKVRCFKNSKIGTYNTIMSALKLISSTLSNYHLRVRINIENATLSSLKQILNDIDFLDREKTTIGIHQIWQVSDDNMDYSKLYDFINEANNRNLEVIYKPINEPLLHVCYADNYNQAVINYNGDVFKCTSRDFTSKNREGTLLYNGAIEWDINKLLERMSITTPDMCEKCKLLPSCLGVCSQRIIEGKVSCPITKNNNIEDIILINFKQKLIRYEN